MAKTIFIELLANANLKSTVTVETHGDEGIIYLHFDIANELKEKSHRLNIITPYAKKFFTKRLVEIEDEKHHFVFEVRTDIFFEDGYYFIGYTNEDGSSDNKIRLEVKDFGGVLKHLRPLRLPVENMSFDNVLVVDLLEKIKHVYFEEGSGTFHFVRADGVELVVDLDTESIFGDIHYDSATNEIVVTTADGKEVRAEIPTAIPSGDNKADGLLDADDKDKIDKIEETYYSQTALDLMFGAIAELVAEKDKRIYALELEVYGGNIITVHLVGGEVPFGFVLPDYISYDEDLKTLIFEENYPLFTWEELFGEGKDLEAFVPVLEHYETDGIYTDVGHTSELDLADKILENPNLYYKWLPVIYDIIYNLNGGTNNPGNPDDFTVEDIPFALLDPSRDGYDFINWHDAVTLDNAVTDITIAQNTELWVEWDAIIYDITYNLDGGVNHLDNPATFTIEDLEFLLEAPSKANHTFDGWFLENTYETPIGHIRDAKDYEVFAKFTLIT